MPGRKLEDRLEQLKQLRTAEPDAAVISTLCKALEDRSNLIVTEAAKTAGRLRLSALIPNLLQSLDRLFEDPAKTDSKCWGKTAIVKALVGLDYSESPPFVRGSRHVQMEPVLGGQEDAAGHLRANCVLALVQCTDLTRTEVFRHLVDRLVDPLDAVRLEAVRAIDQLEGEESPLLLRLKAHVGDERPAVTGQVFDSLLNREGEQGVRFVVTFLDSADPEVRDEAALALGGSRLSAAVNFLIEAWNGTRDHEYGSVLLRALSASRQPAAIDFLLELVKTGMERVRTTALDALDIHRDSSEIQLLVEQAKRSVLK